MLDEIKKDELKRYTCDVIRNTNRVIYSWKNSKHKSLSFTEVKGQVKNWFHRLLKDRIGFTTLNSLLRTSEVSVILDKDGMIAELKIDAYRYAHITDSLREELNTILSSIDYRSLKYDPSDYVLDDIPMKLGDITFDHLRSFKF